MTHTQGLAKRHLGASLALFDALSRAGGGHPLAARVREFVDAPERLLPSTEPFAMKYDGYLAAGTHAAWGFTVNARFDARSVRDFVGDACEAASHAGALLAAVERLRSGLPRPGMTTVSFAFDRVDQPPRLKVYLQEDEWGVGVGTAGEVGAALDACGLGCALPDWVPREALVGVVTLEAPATEPLRAKAYLGTATLDGAFEGAPAELKGLSERMAAACPLASTYYYATLRLAQDQPVRYAVNKIYDLSAQSYGIDRAVTMAAFRDVAGLFRTAGKTRELHAILSEVRRPLGDGRTPRVIPTASAIEDGGRSVDLYCAAFAMDHA